MDLPSQPSSTSTVRSFRQLEVWQAGMDLAVECHRLAKLLPKAEEFRLTSQLLRAAASVPANIAEGRVRSTRKEYARYVSIARGSLAETETFLVLAVRTGMLTVEQTTDAMAIALKLSRQLYALWKKLTLFDTESSEAGNPVTQ
ncbi:MAG: four helix bundle protein [Sphingosinicella sp.]